MLVLLCKRQRRALLTVQVFKAMKSVLEQNPNLQFPTKFAEQTFLTWWFAYTMTKLPM